MKILKKYFSSLVIIIFLQASLLPMFSFAKTTDTVQTSGSSIESSSEVVAQTSDDLQALDSSIQSTAVLIMESTTGKVVYSKNANKKMYPASTTKVLTAIIAIEHCSLDETAIASKNAIESIPSGYTNANIQTGETLSMEDLLYALMLASANEAAIIIAEHISGSTEEFAVLMNEKATELGCTGSNFVNANGIHSEDHYSTAYDMALITQYAMKNETFRKIVATTSYTLPATTIYPKEDRTLTNSNSLIILNTNNVSDNYYRDYAIGVKTGYTTPAGNCLIAAGNKNGLEFVTVVLGANAKNVRYVDTINMFDFAFNNYYFSKLISAEHTVTQIKIENATDETKKLNLLASNDINVLVNQDNKNDTFEPQIELIEDLQAPISQGDIMGTVTYKVDGITYTADLIAASDVEVKEETNIVKVCIIILVIVIVLLIIASILINYKVKKAHIKYKRNRHLKNKSGELK